MLADFHFIRPLWLLALIPVLLLLILLYYRPKQQSPWHTFIAPHLQQAMLGGQALVKKQHFALALLFLCWFISVIALSGPSWNKLPQPAFALKKATVLVLDMSMSMRATDMTPDRLTQQRYLALDFAQNLKEGELGLVSFAGDAYVISPLTPDHNNIRLLIPDLKPEIMPSQGSNLLLALQEADSLLKQGGYVQGDVIVFTDGFDTKSYKDIQNLLNNNWNHRLSILGFGTNEGAPIQLETGELLKSAQGAVVLPKTPHTQLSILAKRTSGIYEEAGLSSDVLDKFINLPALSSLDKNETTQKIAGDSWQDNAIYLVWLLLPLLLIKKRFSPLLGLGVIFFLPMQAPAAEWRDLIQTKQQQAKEDYEQGNFEAAQQKFKDKLWQGNAAYRLGDYQSAEKAYEAAALNAPSAEAFHNLGNSLAQQERFDEALKAYEQALQQNSDFTASAKNAELMKQLLQQQEQKQNNQDKNNSNNQEQSSENRDENSEQQSDKDAQNNDSQNEQSDNAQNNNNTESQESEQDNAKNESDEKQQKPEALNESEKDKKDAPEEKAIYEQWPNATPEQQQQLDNLLRKVQDDPSLLLRNKMQLEHLKRQQQRLPKGVDEQW